MTKNATTTSKDAPRLMCPLENVHENPIALRAARVGVTDFESLKAGIKSLNKIITPIIVYSHPELPGHYVIADGLQRFTIAGQLGMTEVPITVDEDAAKDPMLYQVQSNLHRVATRKAEFANAIRAYSAANRHLTDAQLAQLFGVTKEWLSKLLNLTKLSPATAKMVDDGELPMSKGLLLASLPMDDQDVLLPDAKRQSLEELGKVVSERLDVIKAATKAGKAAAPVERVFIPKARGRSRAEIEAEIAQPAAMTKIVTPDMDQAAVWRAALEFTLSLDAPTVEAARRDWEAAENKRKEDKARKAAERKADAATAQGAQTAEILLS